MSDSFDLRPDEFAAFAVGPPGQRTFYLRALADSAAVTLRLEKQQVGALADYFAAVLRDLPPFEWPEPEAVDPDEPVEPAWTVGSLAVAYEQAAELVLVVAEELVEHDLETGEPLEIPASAHFHLDLQQVAAFVRQGADAVMAGRPPCPLCWRPMDPEGHLCPRNN